ncbi:MAG: dihydrofolate reductase, partial [Rhizobiales bacterium]|nr:dihydrofolate reductase [Hyphomicrobiales bacterium]
PRAARRRRLILTRQVAALAPDSAHPNSLLWNPLGASLDAALGRLAVVDGAIAIIGGTEVFSLFLPRYDAFHLSRAANARIPGGLPVFSEVGPNATPDDVLTRHGLKPGPRRDLDSAAGISVVTWQR